MGCLDGMFGWDVWMRYLNQIFGWDIPKEFGRKQSNFAGTPIGLSGVKLTEDCLRCMRIKFEITDTK